MDAKTLTAVEWLVNALVKHDRTFREFYGAEIEQAKAIEKEQIMNAFENGHTAIINSEQYYNKNYEK